MKIGIVIGRFQGFHEGHRHLLQSAWQKCDELVVLLGSSNKAPSIRNPFSVEQRKEFIEANVPQVVWRFEELEDYLYDDDKWLNQVKTLLEYYKLKGEVTIFAHEKEGNDYLDLFSDIGYTKISGLEGFDGTSFRKEMFENRHSVVAHVQDDWDFYQQEKEKFAFYPYPETLNFCCADAVVECMDHVLLIKRKNAPGKGLWALPGGFKNNDETYLECAIRELKEETGIEIGAWELSINVEQSRMFDSPKRGVGIPRNTMAVHIKLEGLGTWGFPETLAQDDASDVQWVALDKIGKGEFMLHDDHQDIIFTLIK